MHSQRVPHDLPDTPCWSGVTDAFPSAHPSHSMPFHTAEPDDADAVASSMNTGGGNVTHGESKPTLSVFCRIVRD